MYFRKGNLAIYSKIRANLKDECFHFLTFYVQPSDRFLLGDISYEHFGVGLGKLQSEVRLKMP